MSTTDLAAIKLKSPTATAFAGTLFRRIFSTDEMAGKNYRGCGGKGQLDPSKMKKIQNWVSLMYPGTSAEQSSLWNACTKTIDSYIRNKVMREKRNGQLRLLNMCTTHDLL